MIIFTGAPGSGKSTQAKLLAQRLGCPFVSVGQLFRQSFKSGPYFELLEKGELIPEGVANPIIEKELLRYPAGGEIVVDGFLRSPDDIIWLRKLEKADNLKLTAIINVDISDYEAKQRLMGRGRDDDQSTVIDERLKIFRENHQKLKSILGPDAWLIHDVDGTGAPEAVSGRIDSALGISQ